MRVHFEGMSKFTQLERYYMLWRTEQIDIKSLIMNLESRIQELDEKLLRIESETQELKDLINKQNSMNNLETTWIKIRGYAIENSTSLLLNPSRNFRFKIVEVNDDFIRIDKLGKIKLTKEMFLFVFKLLKEKEEWIRIGASVKNTKPDTIEGHLKMHFFSGDMNGQMSASWISAILVRSNVGIIFNNKTNGQAIRYMGN
jgi:hypothetical protein